MPRTKKPPPKAATVAPYSDNRKTGAVAATYASKASCPVTCPFLDCGCYGDYGPTAIIWKRMDEGGVGLTPEQIATQEAIQLDRLPAVVDVRLHVVGDARTDAAAAILASAAIRYTSRNPGVDVWTYTHSWQMVQRAAWGGVSVLASCQTPDEVTAAAERGYAAALVVADFESQHAYTFYDSEGREYRGVPCLYETRKIQCVNCRLCMDDGKLREERRVILFRAGGGGRKSVVRTLEVLNGA